MKEWVASREWSGWLAESEGVGGWKRVKEWVASRE